MTRKLPPIKPFSLWNLIWAIPAGIWAAGFGFYMLGMVLSFGTLPFILSKVIEHPLLWWWHVGMLVTLALTALAELLSPRG